MSDCPVCRGRGHLVGIECQACKGEGVLPTKVIERILAEIRGGMMRFTCAMLMFVVLGSCQGPQVLPLSVIEYFEEEPLPPGGYPPVEPGNIHPGVRKTKRLK